METKLKTESTHKKQPCGTSEHTSENRNEHRKQLSPIIFIFLGFFLALILKLFVFDLTKISGESMSPTLENGKIVVINKLAYGFVIPFKNQMILQWKRVQQGDVVIFLQGTKVVVKRCVATENFPLEFSSESEYSLNVGGKKIPLSKEQFVFLSQYSCVPDGMFLAIGDNYNSSIDSRDFGFVYIKNVAGKVLCK